MKYYMTKHLMLKAQNRWVSMWTCINGLWNFKKTFPGGAVTRANKSSIKS